MSDQPTEMEVEALERAFQSDSIHDATDALLAAVRGDYDPRWLEGWCVKILSGPANKEIRGMAATCLGHLARIYKTIDQKTIELLEKMREDPHVGGRADDALDDIEMFMKVAVKRSTSL